MAKGIRITKAKDRNDFSRINRELNGRGFIALDALRPGLTHNVPLAGNDAANAEAQSLAAGIVGGAWSKGPLFSVAWTFDERKDAVQAVTGEDGKPMGLGYVRWGAGNCIPSVIPPLAQASPYTAAPLRYIADLTTGLGPRLMYEFPDGTLCEYKDAGDLLLQQVESLGGGSEPSGESLAGDILNVVSPGDDGASAQETPALRRARAAYEAWKDVWEGTDVEDEDGIAEHIPGAKEFLEDNNLDLHMMQCEQDDVMLDIYFPTVGFQRGRRGRWEPKIVRVGMLPSHSTRLERQNEWGHINHCYFSDSFRMTGAGGPHETSLNPGSITMYPAAMPQHLLSDLRYIVSSNQKTRIKARPTWVVCPTFYPSLNKPYYPQPAWWSIFTSKAYDFSSTILYDKAKQRENRTSWGRIFYVSLDYLNRVFADEGYRGDKEKQLEFIESLEKSMEDFLQHRENHGKFMRQWMWQGQDGKDHHNVEIVDIPDAKSDEAAAGKNELELSTSPIFLALQVDPRLVGVPMATVNNGGTALREMALLKQQQLNPKQRLYLNFLNTVCRFNGWADKGRAAFHIAQVTLTTLDASKTGMKQTIAGEEA